MEHPLITDVNNLSLEDLQKRITDLNKKLAFAARTGNGALAGQIRMALETFTNKYQQRLDEIYDHNKRQGPDFSDKIDIS